MQEHHIECSRGSSHRRRHAHLRIGESPQSAFMLGYLFNKIVIENILHIPFIYSISTVQSYNQKCRPNISK